MKKIDWVRKLTSRKLWLALAGFVAGLVVALGGDAAKAETISGCVMSGAAVVSYILAEGLNDASYSSASNIEEREEALVPEFPCAEDDTDGGDI